MPHILAIDQGTTSTRAIVFDGAQRVVASAQAEFPQYFPRSGWVEHDLEEIWASVVATARAALAKSGLAVGDIAAIGISNQRETTCIWDRATGRPIHNAIVWQDRRTADICADLRVAGHERHVTSLTGLVLDPYFSATKAAWLLDNVEGARAKAEAGALAFGTIDTFLIQRLTGRHLTDATNAARTLLFDIHEGRWDDALLDLFRVPRAMLPQVVDCAADFGVTDLLGGATPVFGVAGDQQAALIGQACFRPGMCKSTYGTGCFAVLNTGDKPVASNNRLLTTIAYQLDGSRAYALEGAIFVAGAAVQWLRDGLGLIGAAEESGRLAATSDETQDVYLVPAFTGLGAPHWDAQARGAMFGLSRGTGRAEIARAALEAVCFQTSDLMEAMRADWGDDAAPAALRVDGGMAASDWMLQRLSDILAAPVERPHVLETTALGAAWLAGHQAGVWPDMDGFAAAWRAERRFAPGMPAEMRARKLIGWRDAVSRTLTRPSGGH